MAGAEGNDDARVARRLLPQPSATDWIGFCVRILAGASSDERDGVVHTPDHYLAAAWSPPATGWARWPEVVVIGSPTSKRTLRELFAHLPGEARLHLASLDDVDAALAAEILLVTDRNLEPYQREAVARFAQAARDRTASAIFARYSDRDVGFERFRSIVVGAARGGGH